MNKIEIICPAGTLASLKTAVDEGADAVYLGFNDATNARNFPGLNFSREDLKLAINYARAKNCKILVAINTFAKANEEAIWHNAIDDAINYGADAIILADIGLINYARKKFPNARLHLSVQASASNPASINFYASEFDIKRVVLPRVLTLEEIRTINKSINIETEIFAFGGMCPMAEGRCYLSSYVTGQSPNINGVCSPASFVKYKDENSELISQLGEFTINKFSKNEDAGYPTLCKGRFKIKDEIGYTFEDPISLNVLDNIKQVIESGVRALKIEGRQRGKAYIKEVVHTFRAAIDQYYHASNASNVSNVSRLDHLCEGGNKTNGAYERTWR